MVKRLPKIEILDPVSNNGITKRLATTLWNSLDISLYCNIDSAFKRTVDVSFIYLIQFIKTNMKRAIK